MSYSECQIVPENEGDCSSTHSIGAFGAPRGEAVLWSYVIRQK